MEELCLVVGGCVWDGLVGLVILEDFVIRIVRLGCFMRVFWDFRRENMSTLLLDWLGWLGWLVLLVGLIGMLVFYLAALHYSHLLLFNLLLLLKLLLLLFLFSTLLFNPFQSSQHYHQPLLLLLLPRTRT